MVTARAPIGGIVSNRSRIKISVLEDVYGQKVETTIRLIKTAQKALVGEDGPLGLKLSVAKVAKAGVRKSDQL